MAEKRSSLGMSNGNVKADEYKKCKKQCANIMKKSQERMARQGDEKLQNDFKGNRRMFWK